MAKVTLNKAKKTLKKGKSFTLNAKISPATASSKALSWTSSNPQVASVKKINNQKYTVKGKKTGRAKITAQATDGSGKKATCTVTVKPGVKKVKLSSKSQTLTVGDSFKLKATVKPGNAISKKVSWKSSNKGVATVKKVSATRAKVTAKSAGTAKITVKTWDNKRKASCMVTVVAPAPVVVNPPAPDPAPVVYSVWIPRTGTKYHSRSTCSNMKNPTQTTLSNAQSWGYTACSKCW